MDEELIAAARRIERQTGIGAAALLAVATVETNAVTHAVFSGRREPLIRFEGHYFDRLLDERGRRSARAAGLASPKAGAVRNPAAQAARWRMLDRAAAIDPGAAYAATSWGLGQVMGIHWQTLGFDSPVAMAAEARRSVDGQFRVLAKFLAIGRLDRLLESGAYAAFARRYNGPGYLRNAYDTKIEKALKAARKRLALAPGKAPAPMLKRAFGWFGAEPAVSFEPGDGTPGQTGTVSKGWLRRPAMLSTGLSWLIHLLCTPRRTRSFLISTARSSRSATIRPRSGSSPPS